MFVRILLLGTIISACLSSGCQKDYVAKPKVIYDTIFPKPYLPVYPGSFWRYLNDKGDTIVIETAPDYVLTSTIGFEPKVPKDSIYLSLYGVKFIHEYAWVVDASRYNPFGWPLKMLTEGKRDSHVYGGGPREPYAKILTPDTMLQVLGSEYKNVIGVVHGRKYSYELSYYTTRERWYFYAKDIGLVKEVNIRDGTLKLIDYYINR